MSLLLEMQLLRGESADGATKHKYVFVASQQNNVAVLTEIDSAAALTQIEMREVYTLPSTLCKMCIIGKTRLIFRCYYIETAVYVFIRNSVLVW